METFVYLSMGAMFIVALFGLFLAPTIVAASRSHRNLLAIFVLNLLLGWTGFGWIAALIWACMATQQKEAWPEPTSSRRST
jgi:hypothetical protein